MQNCLLEDAQLVRLFERLQANSTTGSLRVIADDREWVLYFQEGRLSFATRPQGLRRLLQVQLQRLGLQIDVGAGLERLMGTQVPEHALLALLVQRGLINRVQVFEVVARLVRSVLLELGELGRYQFAWASLPALEPRCASIQPLALLAEVRAYRSGWESLKPHIDSPQQVLHIRSLSQLQQQLPAVQCARLQALLDGERTLSAVADALGQDALTLARALAPLVQSDVLAPGPAPQSPGLLVACIDDSPTIGMALEKILLQAGLRSLYIDRPLQSLSRLLREPPALIFLDLSMPDIDGYQLCRLIRRSPALKDVPVVMLTSKDGLFDRARANLVGASEYLTKPVQAAKVLAVLEQYGLIAAANPGSGDVFRAMSPANNY